ncbi:MAG: nodulation protein NfeD, partial [Chloroflexi bacterium]|nr:nodulation protein NfeD [Chloroflexota bacterium]
LLLVLLGLSGPVAAYFLPNVSAQGRQVAVIEIDAIDPISAGFLGRGIDLAADEGAHLIVILLDTPGGFLDSTRDMVEKILASEVPIVVFVTPPGAQAASAGTFITASAHVAAMSPTTNIGAASPVGPSGEDLPDTLESKAIQDTAAFMRSIAEQRGRNSEALEDTVLRATSYSASEALDKGIIDLIAKDLDDLLSQLDGRTIEMDRGDHVLETNGLEVRKIGRNPVERFLGLIADPNIAFLLVSLGGIGLIVELWNPGLFVPGVAGVIALGLGFVALGNLPVNWVGAGLLMLGIALFFAELQAPGIGVFGVAGGVCFVLGAFLLFGDTSAPGVEAPSVKVSIWAILGVSVILAAFLLALVRLALQSRRLNYPTQIDSLVGKTGVTTTELRPRGTVQVASEMWSAVSDSGQPIDEGEEVLVLEVDGLTLKVFRANEPTE